MSWHKKDGARAGAEPNKKVQTKVQHWQVQCMYKTQFSAEKRGFHRAKTPRRARWWVDSIVCADSAPGTRENSEEMRGRSETNEVEMLPRVTQKQGVRGSGVGGGKNFKLVGTKGSGEPAHSRAYPRETRGNTRKCLNEQKPNST